jgi:ABC-type uncharacterized transport system substrate-binding protein
MKIRRGASSNLAILFFLTLFCAMAILPFAASAEKKEVLIIHSYHKGYKWTEDEGKGIEDAIKASGLDVTIQTEYLDTKRVTGEGYFQQVSEIYKQRFADRKFSVILVTDDDAFNFIFKYRDKIFGEPVPVVFAGCNDFDRKRLIGVKNITGVNEAADVKDNIDLIVRINPGIRKIVMITDNTISGQIVKQTAETIIPSYSNMNINFEFTDHLDMPQILAKLKELPANSAVLFTFYAKDRAGKFFEFKDSATMITAASRVPVYSMWDFNLGYGVVGGKLTNGLSQGTAAGEMAVKILKGENVESIPVLMNSPNKYIFDWDQLDRWSIKMSQLPSDSTFINRPQYSLIHIGLITAGIMILGILIYIYKKVI